MEHYRVKTNPYEAPAGEAIDVEAQAPPTSPRGWQWLFDCAVIGVVSFVLGFLNSPIGDPLPSAYYNTAVHFPFVAFVYWLGVRRGRKANRPG